MSDDSEKKVVSLFSAHKKTKCPAKKTQNVCQSPEGYYYVAVETDENGRHFDEKDLLARANAFYYIVKVMVKDGPRVFIHNYKVSAEDLMKFIKIYVDGRGDGQIIEIDKFFEEDWA
ncbi:MAG: hypothetical protein GX568_04525 [Candidatus Gastranaerophilales bacterium]|jgi:hypothetical protein|nr:hypothetical protein [Candidatus Gastranaerophilales bacterium]